MRRIATATTILALALAATAQAKPNNKTAAATGPTVTVENAYQQLTVGSPSSGQVTVTWTNKVAVNVSTCEYCKPTEGASVVDYYRVGVGKFDELIAQQKYVYPRKENPTWTNADASIPKGTFTVPPVAVASGTPIRVILSSGFDGERGMGWAGQFEHGIPPLQAPPEPGPALQVQ